MATQQTPDEFLQQEIKEFADFLKEQAKLSLLRHRIRVSDELLNSLAVQVAKDTLQLSFRTRGRFRDMGAGRAYHKGKYVGTRIKDIHLLKGRKPKKWYSRTVYGAVYGTLVNNLQNKYISATADTVRQNITD